MLIFFVRYVILLVLCSIVVNCVKLSECDPIDPYKCYLPFPNNFWLRNGSLSYGINTFPHDISGKPINAAEGGWNDLDGFSPVPSIIIYASNVSLELSNLPRVWNEAYSLSPSCNSFLLDTVTNELLPHFTEVDHRSDYLYPDGQYNRALMMWPLEALTSGRRYIVAYRNLRNTSDDIILSSYAFKALRDNISTHNPDIELRRPLFRDIFKRLSNHDIKQSSLYIAWDFQVASQDNLQGRMIHIRDDAFKKRIKNGIHYKIWQVDDNYSAFIYRKVQGTFRAPSYMKSILPNTTFAMNSSTGLPEFQGYMNANFTIMIPRSLMNGSKKASLLQYGHGLFGTRGEVENKYLQNISDTFHQVMLATDFIGLSREDAPYVIQMMTTDLTRFNIVPDRCAQGMLNALLAMHLTTTKLVNDPALIINGKRTLDHNPPAYYYGNSQGGILGAVYMAVSQEVKRGVLGVPGGPYSLMLPRAIDYVPFWDNLVKVYPDPFDRIILFGIIQQLWNRLDPGGYMSHITNNPPRNTPKKEVLIQYGVGDAQDTYLSIYTVARSIKASMFQSNVRIDNETLYGFPFISDYDIGHNAMLVGWQFPHTPPVPQINIPPNKSADTHEQVRRQYLAQLMMETFFETGQIVNFCNHTCHGIRVPVP